MEQPLSSNNTTTPLAEPVRVRIAATAADGAGAQMDLAGTVLEFPRDEWNAWTPDDREDACAEAGVGGSQPGHPGRMGAAERVPYGPDGWPAAATGAEAGHRSVAHHRDSRDDGAVRRAL
ncbi:hypothetical protein OHQ88_34060 (plasmid) [Micromonospora zamorensis]|uniref:hypothetical protein n=1 Tax=Micromonospora zamorensis TaxID=709883 RepID=UPI002E2064D0